MYLIKKKFTITIKIHEAYSMMMNCQLEGRRIQTKRMIGSDSRIKKHPFVVQILLLLLLPAPFPPLPFNPTINGGSVVIFSLGCLPLHREGGGGKVHHQSVCTEYGVVVVAWCVFFVILFYCYHHHLSLFFFFSPSPRYVHPPPPLHCETCRLVSKAAVRNAGNKSTCVCIVRTLIR